MDFKEMNIEEIEARKAEILEAIDNPEADLDALEEEMRSIKEELESRKAIEAQKVEIRQAIADAEVPTETVETIEIEERKLPTMSEIRNSKEYIDAFAEYIKTENDAECRALLTENVSGGTVAVPDMVYDIVKTAWEREGIIARVRKAYIKGNLKVGFEISGDDAIIHTEGGNAITPENLVLGTVELVPQSIKKAVQISDEVYDLRGSAFLEYIYDELVYRIAKKAADTLVGKIATAGTASTTTAVGVPAIVSTTVSLGLVASAISQLSDEADNPAIIMNKATWAAFKAAQYAANYPVDPFENLPVLFNNSLKSLTAASSGDTWMIVGDLDHGALMNFPNGEDITIKFDDMTYKKEDLIEVFGRQFVAMGVVAPNAFVNIKK